MDENKKLKLYLLMLSRYKDLINEKEAKTVTEIKERVSPHHPFIENLKKRILPDNYKYEKDFVVALNRAVSYVSTIETIELSINFWMDFSEMEEMGAADSANKAILLASLLRSFGSDNAKIIITKGGNYYISFIYEGKTHLFSTKTNSLMLGEDAAKVLASDAPKCSFNDLAYENFEE